MAAHALSLVPVSAWTPDRRRPPLRLTCGPTNQVAAALTSRPGEGARGKHRSAGTPRGRSPNRHAEPCAGRRVHAAGERVDVGQLRVLAVCSVHGQPPRRRSRRCWSCAVLVAVTSTVPRQGHARPTAREVGLHCSGARSVWRSWGQRRAAAGILPWSAGDSAASLPVECGRRARTPSPAESGGCWEPDPVHDATPVADGRQVAAIPGTKAGSTPATSTTGSQWPQPNRGCRPGPGCCCSLTVGVTHIGPLWGSVIAPTRGSAIAQECASQKVLTARRGRASAPLTMWLARRGPGSIGLRSGCRSAK